MSDEQPGRPHPDAIEMDMIIAEAIQRSFEDINRKFLHKYKPSQIRDLLASMNAEADQYEEAMRDAEEWE